MAQTDTARSWALVLILGVGTSIAYIDRVLLSFATPTLMKDLGLSGAVAGLLLSAFFWSYTVMQIPSGWLVDRYGSKWVLAIGYTIWSISCAATGGVSSFAGLIACRLGLGIGESPIYPTCYRVVATVFSERHRGLASAIYSEGAKIGPAIGAPLAAWLIFQFGWRTMFVVVGFFSLMWLLFWLKAAPTHQETTSGQHRGYDRTEWSALLKRREVWGIILGYFGYLYVFFVYVTWLPGYLILTHNFSILRAGWFSSVPFIVQFLLGLLSGWVADLFIHRGYSATLVRKLAIGLGLLIGLAIVPAAFVDSGEVAAALFTISLAGLGIAVPNMLAVPSSLAPEGRGGVIGALQNTGGNLGGVLAPVITGVLYGAEHNFTLALAVAGAMLGLSAFGYLVLVVRIEPMRLAVKAH